jgi:hypothetical protein
VVECLLVVLDALKDDELLYPARRAIWPERGPSIKPTPSSASELTCTPRHVLPSPGMIENGNFSLYSDILFSTMAAARRSHGR